MSFFEAVLSGIIQGITEFLPISSSAHLVLLHTFCGYKEPKVLEDVVLHGGTLIAVLVFFWRSLQAALRDYRSVGLLIIGTVPIVLVGYFLGPVIESLFTNTTVVGGALLVTALWLFAADRSLRTTSEEQRTRNIGAREAVLIGLVQAGALVPGISRSGVTIATALLLKKRGERAFEFSFLLSIPAVCGALIYKMRHLAGVDPAHFSAMMAGGVSACIVGIGALWCLKQVLYKKRLTLFGLYCAGVGLFLLIVS
jgi:undecaprenyl-diphosphatase